MHLSCLQPRQGRKTTRVAHSLTLLLAHVVFSTKERRPWLDAGLRADLFAYLGGIAREHKARALIVNGVADHVHLLVAYPPVLAVAELMRLLKTNSSLWLHRQHGATHRLFSWQIGYGAFSVSHSATAAVTKYIANQEARHRRGDYESEIKALYRAHNIAFDARFVLG